MAVGIGASTVVGIALEVTAGTYVAPAKFFPVRSESLRWVQNTNFRTVLRGVAEPLGAVAGNGNVEGDLDMEVQTDVVPYFLFASRGTVVKSGLIPDFVYTLTPSAAAVPTKTMSVTIVRNGIVFGYVGCVVSASNYSVDNGMAVVTYSLLGRSEAVQTAPTATYVNDAPMGEGSYTVEIPTATQVFDTDSFTLSIDDGAQVANRLKNSLGAQFIHFGERTINASVERDFESRAEYDAFKALTAKSVTVKMAVSAARYVNLIVPAAITENYEINVGGVGDLVRAGVTYQGVYDTTTGAGVRVVCGSGTDITP